MISEIPDNIGISWNHQTSYKKNQDVVEVLDTWFLQQLNETIERIEILSSNQELNSGFEYIRILQNIIDKNTWIVKAEKRLVYSDFETEKTVWFSFLDGQRTMESWTYPVMEFWSQQEMIDWLVLINTKITERAK